MTLREQPLGVRRRDHRDGQALGEVQQLCRGRTVVDLYRRTGLEPNAHVAVDVDADAFLELVIERLSTMS